MVGDDNVTSFTVEADIGTVAGCVFGGLNDEHKIDGDALVTLGSAAGIVLAAG